MRLEIAMSTLQCEIEIEELLFWGKITGIKNDYFIAVGIQYSGCYEFPTKKFFYALSSDFEFKEMPTLNDQHKDVINSETSLYMGEPLRKVGQVGEGEDGEAEKEEVAQDEDEEGEDGQPKKLDSDASEEEEIKIPKRPLTELDRLTYTVYAIENDC